MDVREGPGRFQWSAGSWFGTQIGATLWIPMLGFLMLVQGRTAGAGILALAAVVNGFGIYLWSQRDKREPYPSVQLLLGASAVVAVVSVLLASAGADGPSEHAPSLVTLLAYPALMLVVYLQERSSRSEG